MRIPIAAALLVSLAGPASATPADSKTGEMKPKPNSVSNAYDVFDNSLSRPVARVFDLPRWARRATGHPREAANVDAADQVRLPSTWWQPRVGFRTVTPAQMLRGPGPGTGPAGTHWIVTHTKDHGVTPGFQIKDEDGKSFLLKFDPPDWPEMASGAAVVGAKLFWAAGYNVPDDAIAVFSLDDLSIAKGATYTDGRRRKHPMTRAYLEKLLARAARRPDGKYRCIASRFLEGAPLGPFSYQGRRHDDPEDLIPHELRRELRGLWVLCAWTNHSDSRGPNSLDTWVTEGGRSFVRHHLIDFSGILGAGPAGPHTYATGTEYYVDPGILFRQMSTLGLARFQWESCVDPHLPAVGFVDGDRTFDPDRWRPDYPNPAFDDRTARDARWGARIVAGMNDELIRAAVGAAHYSDPRAADYLVRVLIERRDRIVSTWLGENAKPREIVSR